MSVCEHDSGCSGFGWAHDALLTLDQRLELGLPIEGEISVAHAKRLMRAYRKGWGDGFALGVDQAKNNFGISVQEEEVEDVDE